MCCFSLQCPHDKSDSDGGASPAAPGDHLGGCSVTHPCLEELAAEQGPSPGPHPCPTTLGSGGGGWGSSRKGLTGILYGIMDGPHSGDSG